jgi:membrane-bound lytic murein transglycosylase D
MARAESEFGTNFPRILEDYEGPLFGFDSRNFYVEFLAAREVARNAERYFAEVNRERPLSWEKVALERPAPIYKVARDYGVTLSELTEMNAALTNSALKGQVSLPEGTSIWLPKGTQERLASRSTEDEAPVVRQIRVVRAPDSTADRMVAMIENPLSTSTKVDVPAARRVTFVRSKAGRNSNGRTSEHKNVSARHVKTEKVAVEKATVSTKAVAEKSPSAKAKVASVKVTSPKDSHTKVAAAEITPRSVKSSEHQVKTLTKTEAKAKVKVAQASAASTKSVSGKGSSAAPIKVATVKAAPVKAANKPVVVSKKSGGKVAAATKGSSSHRG